MVDECAHRPLPLRVLIRVAAQNIGRNRARSALALAAIACGVVGLIGSGGFVHDLIFQLGEAVIHSQSGHIQIAKAGYFEGGTRLPGKYLIPASDIERLAANKMGHVSLELRRLSFSGLLSTGRASYPIVGEGIEPHKEAKLGTYMIIKSGRYLTAKDRYGVLIGAGVAHALNLKPGSPVSLVAPTVDGAMNTIDLDVVGTFQSYSKDYDDRVIKVSLKTAQELLNTRGVNVLVLLLDRTRNTAEVASALAGNVKRLGLELKTWEQLNDFYAKTVALYNRQFGVLQLIVLVMVMLAVAGAINMAVFERAGEFGTMRALGNTSGDVARLIVVEGALMGLLGALIGGALGTAAAWAISKVGIPMPPPPNSNLGYAAHIRLTLGIVEGALLVGLGATILASVPPALRMARLPIVEALRRAV